MSQKILPKNEALLKHKTFKKKFINAKYVSWFLFLLIGFSLGFICSKFYSTKKVQSNIGGSYRFVNPYILTSVYDSIHHNELTNFKQKILDYCDETKKTESDIKQISVYFRDLSNGFWFGINEREKFIPASLVKVTIMIATFQIAEKDSLYLKRKLTYKPSKAEIYLKQHPEIDDLRTTMQENKSYTIEELVELMITKSDNEAGMMLCEDFGWDHWNALQSRLKDVDINSPPASNIITVKGYSSFFRILYNASLLTRKYSDKALEILSRAEYDKGIRAAIPSDIVLCHKYGERDTLTSPTSTEIRQLHHAGIIYYPGKTFFLCVMTKGKNKVKMEKIIQEITTKVYSEVDRQVRKFKIEKPEKDVN